MNMCDKLLRAQEPVPLGKVESDFHMFNEVTEHAEVRAMKSAVTASLAISPPLPRPNKKPITTPVNYENRNDVIREASRKGLMDRRWAAVFRYMIPAIASGHSTTEMLQQIGLDIHRFMAIVARDPALEKLVNAARSQARLSRAIRAEDAALKRAVDGVTEEIFCQRTGKKIGEKQVYSDSLLQTVLKAEEPDKYADRQQVSHKGVTLNVQVDGIPGMENLFGPQQNASFETGGIVDVRSGETNSTDAPPKKDEPPVILKREGGS